MADSEKRPRTFKTQLCKFFLEGEGVCTKGKEACPHAHGTRELRGYGTNFTPQNAREAGLNIKMKLCEVHINSGNCMNGPQCEYAHCAKEIEEALQSAESCKDMSKFKTKMCESFMRLGYCEYGKKCGYAHGHHELKIPKGESSNYKTELCVHWSQGLCNNGDKCKYAHGELELRVPKGINPKNPHAIPQAIRPPVAPPPVQMAFKQQPQYGSYTASGSSTVQSQEGRFFDKRKTAMCKNLPNCPHGDRCNYAHSQAELRTEVPLSDSGLPVPIPTSARPDMASSWESTPRVIGPGSSSMSFSGPHGQVAPSPPSTIYKTELCDRFMTAGFCPYGPKCQFAHGGHELQATGVAGMKRRSEGPPQAERSNKKTRLCRNFQENNCERGIFCSFAHGEKELVRF